MRPDDNASRIGIVLLAAGASTRLGRPKQLLPWQSGVSLLRHIAGIATAFASPETPVVVVLGAGAEELYGELEGLPVTPVVNAEWEEGMAASLRVGIAALTDAAPSVDTALVMLCDQPRVTPGTLQALAEAQQRTGCPAVVSDYSNGGFGPPCLFARALFPDLLALRGAAGARQILARLPADQIARVPFPEGALDIDTPEDWERAQNKTL